MFVCKWDLFGKLKNSDDFQLFHCKLTIFASSNIIFECNVMNHFEIDLREIKTSDVENTTINTVHTEIIIKYTIYDNGWPEYVNCNCYIKLELLSIGVFCVRLSSE